MGDQATMQAETRVNTEQASKTDIAEVVAVTALAVAVMPMLMAKYHQWQRQRGMLAHPDKWVHPPIGPPTPH